MQGNSQLHSLLEQCLTENQLRKIAIGLIADAASADVRVRLPARTELFNRLYGKPAPHPIDPQDDGEAAAMKLSDQELIDLFQKQLNEQKRRGY